MISFRVEGAPQGKARPRFSKSRVYTPSKTKAYEYEIGYACKEAMIKSNQKMIESDGAKVIIKAFYAIPKRFKNTVYVLCGDIKPTAKPDVDNIAKVILDAVNGVAYKDDKQVTDLTVEKRYSIKPFVKVSIEGMEVNKDEKQFAISNT